MAQEKFRILLVEDEKPIRDAVTAYLEREEKYSVVGVGDGQSAVEEFEKHQFDLVILDLMLPKLTGERVCRAIRDTSEVPIIMLTAKGEVDDRIIGLQLGADDYLVKPFGMLEMVSRVKAVLRRSLPKDQPSLLRCGEIAVDKARHLVTVQGMSVSLTLKEFELLCLFMENPGLVFTRDQLLRSVWGAEFVGESRTVDVHIGTLRTKLGQAGKCIGTVRGVGYKLERES